jgi:hypothetical protein
MTICQRCKADTLCTIMSMYSRAMICMDCKDKETQRSDYNEAQAKDVREYAGRLDALGKTQQADSCRELAAKLEGE